MPSATSALDLLSALRPVVEDTVGAELVHTPDPSGAEDSTLRTSYVSSAASADAAAAQLRDLAFALIDAGYQVKAFPGHLEVTDREGVRASIAHGVTDAQGTAHTPEDGDAGALSSATIETIYWANFYAHVTYDSGSTFEAHVAEFDGAPTTVVDIGCGDGRDSFAFGRTGRTVTGIDRSHIGVQHASKHSEELGLGELVSFRAVDVSDVPAVRKVLTEVTATSPDAPVLFYMRFFLHSIPADVQAGLMSVIAEVARPGDVLAAEFRTDKDAALQKVHGGHFRRYQSAAEFRSSLTDQYGFDEVLAEAEGTGLSPYRDEDPELYRVIARRSS